MITGKGLTQSDPVQLNTIQRVNCRGGTGTFTLTFRGETTLPISWDSLQGAVVTALEALPTVGVGGVAVILYSGRSFIDFKFIFSINKTNLFILNFSDCMQCVRTIVFSS